jgi:hypothetical protein
MDLISECGQRTPAQGAISLRPPSPGGTIAVELSKCYRALIEGFADGVDRSRYHRDIEIAVLSR